MRRDEVIEKLKTTEPALRTRGVDALYLFGSHARGEAHLHSDADVFVDPVSDDAFGFLQYMESYETIRRAIGNDIDLGYSTREGLDRYIRADVERQAVRIF